MLVSWVAIPKWDKRKSLLTRALWRVSLMFPFKRLLPNREKKTHVLKPLAPITFMRSLYVILSTEPACTKLISFFNVLYFQNNFYSCFHPSYNNICSSILTPLHSTNLINEKKKIKILNWASAFTRQCKSENWSITAVSEIFLQKYNLWCHRYSVLFYCVAGTEIVDFSTLPVTETLMVVMWDP
jgi:hypothetical protein